MACRMMLGSPTSWLSPLRCAAVPVVTSSRRTICSKQVPARARQALPLGSSAIGLPVLPVARRQTVRNRRGAVDCRAVATATSDAQAAQAGSNGKAQQGPTFQEAIFKLQEYWATVGCAVWLPHNTEVGAGTMNPATFLRVLGPEPWNVCYAEPSIRPDDSRYGDNPNRVQRHTQFQVILKPDPGNPQELYLGSLQALGIDTRKHDVRFVEDNWESPVLGAWGLGWEVWLDGMEVTQFTYFQQAGGKPLAVPAVEITYGLERILMALQGVSHFTDIRYAPGGLTYGELFLQNEYEMSVYNLDQADVADQRERFALFEREARRMLDRRLPIPAYDHLLKLSHTFNILDARGAVGVTERANCFAAMRALSREVTGLWVARREELEHPLGQVPALQPPAPSAPSGPVAGEAAPLVLELGSEELPPDDVEAAAEQLRQRVPELLQKLRLTHGEVRVLGTPRRLAVLVDDVATRQPDAEDRVRGPPAKAAYKDGSPTKALEGFCKKNGVSAADCSLEADAKGVEYVWATVRSIGRPSAVVLTEELSSLVASLSFKKSMRWNSDSSYSRPLRWLLALHGDVALPFIHAGLQAGCTTRLLRNGDKPEAQIPSANEYQRVLELSSIVLDPERRAGLIWEQVKELAADAGGCVPDSARQGLLPEVTNLVEAPTPVLGRFDEQFLRLPSEVLVMVMRKHQRYFPVYTDSSHTQLTNAFVTVANGPVDLPTVRVGNEAVLRARFEDASFFYDADLKTKLEELVPLLKGTTFQKDLGSLYDKSRRTVDLVQPLAGLTGLQAAAPTALAAAGLARADLASSVVMEMTALAGTMGRHYALQQGADPQVADAIYESVLPRQAGDELPKSPAGVLVAVADRLDSLVGLFAAGCAPSASADPYALRRTAYGMLQAAVANGVSFDLRKAVGLAAGVQPVEVTQEAQDAAVEFVVRRLEQLLVDEGCPIEAVRAVLAERGNNPSLAAAGARQLAAEMAAKDEGSSLSRVLAALARPTRIVRGKRDGAAEKIDPSLFETPEEKALHQAFVEVADKVSGDMPVGEFLGAAERLAGPIDAFFDKVLVMCEEEGVRANRLALLREVADLPRGVMDLAELPGF